MSSNFIIVAPSLEMVTFPLSSWINLSIPRGPNVVLTTSATAVHAFMLLTNCAFPCDVSVPSFSSMICGCCSRFKTQTESVSSVTQLVSYSVTDYMSEYRKIDRLPSWLPLLQIQRDRERERE